MGLADSGAMFQRTVEDTVGHWHIDGCEAYVDDILIHVADVTTHDQILQKVLISFDQKDFRINPDKCEFAIQSVKFLGQVVHDDKVTPDPDKVKAVLDFAIPSTVKQVLSFLGTINYFSDRIPHAASLAEPLN